VLAQKLNCTTTTLVTQQNTLTKQLYILILSETVANKLQSLLVLTVRFINVACAIVLSQHSFEKGIARTAVNCVSVGMSLMPTTYNLNLLLPQFRHSDPV
jgi:hypothetical protein